MSTLSTVSIPLILIGGSSQRAIIFTIELPKGQVLFTVFMNSDIITELVYEHTTVEPVVVQKHDEKNTLLVFTESENIEKICNTLQSIEMWLGHSVTTGCDVATPKQVLMADQLCWVGRDEIVSVEKSTNMQLPR